MIAMKMPKLVDVMSSPVQTDSFPYLSKQIPVGGREMLELVGGTVAWNQHYNVADGTSTDNGITFVGSSADGTLTLSGTANSTANMKGNAVANVANHIYLINGNSSDARFFFSSQTFGDAYGNVPRIIKNTSTNAKWYYTIRPTASAVGVEVSNVVLKPQVFDLTQMFGSTIADYVYSLEQASAGSGLAWLQTYGFFTADYYPYNAGELLSVKTSAHEVTVNGSSTTYPLSNIELRGIPKLVSNELQYDGDVYKADGSVTRKYGIQVFDGTATVQDWRPESPYYSFNLIPTPKAKFTHGQRTVISNRLQSLKSSDVWNGTAYGVSSQNQNNIGIRVEGVTTAEELRTWLTNNPLTVVYELATPTTETTDAYESVIPVEENGVESFVDERTVPMPVGNTTKYHLIQKAERIWMQIEVQNNETVE